MPWVRTIGDEVAEIYDTTRTHVGPMRRGRRIVQRFVAERDGLCGLSVCVGTYGRRIDSVATLCLLDAEGERELRRCRLNTAPMSDNTWQCFPFDPLPASEGCGFCFAFETDADGDGAVTLWANDSVPSGAACREPGAPSDKAACFKCRYTEDVSTLLDPLLFRGSEGGPGGVPPVAPEAKSTLREIIAACVKAKGLYFLRLAHLADAVGRTRDVRRILSVGCGEAYQEAFLAARLPGTSVLGTDLVLLPGRRFSAPNLQFQQRDILQWSGGPEDGAFDLVFSIECLEHIHEYRTAFRNMAAKVRPGGFLYVSVPFASAAEQRDPRLREYEWREHEHVLPGFTFEDLEGLCAEAGFDVLHASNMFRVPLVTQLNGLLDKMTPESIDASLGEVGRLFLLDVDGRRVGGRADGSHGVRILARRR